MAFWSFKVQLVLPQDRKCLPQACDMICPIFTKDQYAIKEDKYVSFSLMPRMLKAHGITRKASL